MMKRLLTPLLAVSLMCLAPGLISNTKQSLMNQLNQCGLILQQGTSLSQQESYEDCMIRTVNPYRAQTGIPSTPEDVEMHSECANCLVDIVTEKTNQNLGMSLQEKQAIHQRIMQCLRDCPNER